MRTPASGFDLLAPFYDLIQRMFFGRSLIRAQTHFLKTVTNIDTVLVVGGGTGQILIEMLKSRVGQKFDYIEISKKMIRSTKRRVRDYHKRMPSTGERASIVFLCNDIARAPLKKYDLIVTPFCLDCCTDETLSALIPKMAKSLNVNGSWIFTDFHIGPGFTGYFSRVLVRFLYFCFNTVCALERSALPNFAKYFHAAGLVLKQESLQVKGMVVTRIYRLSANLT